VTRKAAGGVLTATQAPHRPGTAPAPGLRAGRVVPPFVEQTAIAKKRYKGVPMSLLEVEVPRESADVAAPLPAEHALALDEAWRPLAGEDPVEARVVGLRHFAGLGHDEFASVLGITLYQAVQHAHQKGVIQRDLKPGNVLVTEHNGTPVAKVIDFGVAKAVGQERTDKSLFAGFAQLIGTPLYMSPDQARRDCSQRRMVRVPQATQGV
jgi:hypothetical protein